MAEKLNIDLSLILNNDFLFILQSIKDNSNLYNAEDLQTLINLYDYAKKNNLAIQSLDYSNYTYNLYFLSMLYKNVFFKQDIFYLLLDYKKIYDKLESFTIQDDYKNINTDDLFKYNKDTNRFEAVNTTILDEIIGMLYNEAVDTVIESSEDFKTYESILNYTITTIYTSILMIIFSFLFDLGLLFSVLTFIVSAVLFFILIYIDKIIVFYYYIIKKDIPFKLKEFIKYIQRKREVYNKNLLIALFVFLVFSIYYLVN